MSDEVNKEAINKEFVQESQWCYVEGDESSVGTVQVPVRERAFTLISSLAMAVLFCLHLSHFNFAILGHRRLLLIEDYLGFARTSLHNDGRVYMTPYSSKGFKLF